MVVETLVGSPQFPQINSKISPTNQAELDDALNELDHNKDKWVQTSPAERKLILEQLLKDMTALMQRWVDASLDARDLKQGTIEAGDEWASAASTIRLLRLLRDSLDDIAKHGTPRIPGAVKTRADGTVSAQVFPQNTFDRLLFPGMTAEVWMQEGVTESNIKQHQAEMYRDKTHTGKVGLVLAAGNVSTLPPGDFLYHIFAADQVSILKMNPVNAYLGPLIEEGFKALIDRGALRVVYGGIDVADYLIHHDLVEDIHLTGSDKTFEAITFGAGEEGQRNKANRTPIMNKSFSAELGSISPTIVVPGPWTQKEIDTQASEIASMLTNNAGFMCVATRVIVNHKGWDQRDQLMQAIEKVFEGASTRKAYYPGAHQRHETFVEAHPEAIQIGDGSGDKLPWTIIPDVDSEADDIVFHTEAFCSLFAETALEADSVADYIDKAVEFANNRLWGTLTATLIIHPKSLKDPAVKAALDRAEANLQYGSVCINVWGAMSYFLGLTTWGGIPGHDKYDVQSGIGYINNALMFDRPVKSIIRRSFHQLSRPVVVTSKAYPEFARKFLYFESNPSWGKLPSVVWTALQS